MKVNLIDVGRKLLNLGLGLFGNRIRRVDFTPEETSNILMNAEREVFGEKGIGGIDKEKTSELKIFLLRSFAQYLVNRKIYQPKIVLFSLYVLFSCLLIITLLYLFLIEITRRKGTGREKADIVIFYHYTYLKAIVDDLFSDRDRIFVSTPCYRLTKRDVLFFFRCVRAYPRMLAHPWFLFSFIKWMSIYSGLIYVYRPKIIVNFFEDSAASSIMTYYLREQNVTHINHMHGEHFFVPRVAFCEFDYFYVYGDYWRDLFTRLRCKAQFVVKINKHYKELFERGHEVRRGNGEKRLLIIHSRVLTSESEECGLLVRVLKLVPEDWDVRFRFHPNEKQQGKAFLKYLMRQRFEMSVKVDDFQECPLEKSLVKATVVVGKTSVALLEAWVSGCRVIHLDQNPELKFRYMGSKNVFFAKGDMSDYKLKEFLLCRSSIGLREDKLINHVTRVS